MFQAKVYTSKFLTVTIQSVEMGPWSYTHQRDNQIPATLSPTYCCQSGRWLRWYVLTALQVWLAVAGKAVLCHVHLDHKNTRCVKSIQHLYFSTTFRLTLCICISHWEWEFKENTEMVWTSRIKAKTKVRKKKNHLTHSNKEWGGRRVQKWKIQWFEFEIK